jgi:hypothetical protein
VCETAEYRPSHRPAHPAKCVERVCFPDRRKSILGGSERNFLFRTVRKTNIAPLAVRATAHGAAAIARRTPQTAVHEAS